MMAKVDNLSKIEAKGIKHVHDGLGDIRFLMAELTTKDYYLEIECKSVYSNALLIKGIKDPHVLELAKDLYLVKDLIVQQMNVVRKLQDSRSDPIKLPFFSIDKFPFVIVRGYSKVYLVNVKECTMWLLIKAKCEIKDSASRWARTPLTSTSQAR